MPSGYYPGFIEYVGYPTVCPPRQQLPNGGAARDEACRGCPTLALLNQAPLFELILQQER